MLALLGAHPILHVSRIRVNLLYQVTSYNDTATVFRNELITNDRTRRYIMTLSEMANNDSRNVLEYLHVHGSVHHHS
jgi:hypothetical protein